MFPLRIPGFNCGRKAGRKAEMERKVQLKHTW